ncbi:ABC transporter permease [Pandoraea terrae]|uniref:ABC transporter permease n=1 Tax=Pandoraea terrae TaxID=1537710 RepID=A0A5E4VXV5_9BURK|nr:ABC transporter permease [Pandoraea terrae]VVE16961.1 ABC transporter permease [Pandoraea terrae]
MNTGWKLFLANRGAVAGALVLVLIVLSAMLGPVLYHVAPFDMVGAPMTGPGGEQPLGTDYLGRDVLAGLLYGARTTLEMGVAATLCTVFIGVTIGALAGFHGGWVDNLLMRITEFFQVLPPILLAMVLVAVIGPSILTIVLVIGAVSWTPIARLTRAEFMKIKEREFVMAARAVGARSLRIMFRVILPNALPPLIVSGALTIGVAILFESGLSFIGLGDPDVMSWGYMIGNSRDRIFDSWWAVMFPGLAIFLTVFAISLIGDGLNDAFNPKLRNR